MGLVFIGPILGSSALPLLSRATFVLQENTGDPRPAYNMNIVLLPSHIIAVQKNHHLKHPKSIHKTSLEYLFDQYSQKSSSTTSSTVFAFPPSSTWLFDLENIQCSLGSHLTLSCSICRLEIAIINGHPL